MGNVSGNLGCTGRVCALKHCSRCARRYLARLTSVYCKHLVIPDQTNSLGCTLTDAHLFDRFSGVEDTFREEVKLGGCTVRVENVLGQSILSVTASFLLLFHAGQSHPAHDSSCHQRKEN